MTEQQGKSLTRRYRGAILGIVVAGLLVTAFLGWSMTCPWTYPESVDG